MLVLRDLDVLDKIQLSDTISLAVPKDGTDTNTWRGGQLQLERRQRLEPQRQSGHQPEQVER